MSLNDDDVINEGFKPLKRVIINLINSFNYHTVTLSSVYYLLFFKSKIIQMPSGSMSKRDVSHEVTFNDSENVLSIYINTGNKKGF